MEDSLFSFFFCVFEMAKDIEMIAIYMCKMYRNLFYNNLFLISKQLIH